MGNEKLQVTSKTETGTMSRNELIAKVESSLPTNGKNSITAQDLRDVFIDFANNMYSLVSDNVKDAKYNNTYTAGGFLDALIYCAGDVSVSGDVMNRIKGSYTIGKPDGFSSSQTSEHRIYHDLGHENYICLGVALGQRSARTVKFNCYEKKPAYCDIVTADDASTNAEPFSFVIINLLPFTTN